MSLERPSLSAEVRKFLLEPEGLTVWFLVLMGIVIFAGIIIAVQKLRRTRDEIDAAVQEYRKSEANPAHQMDPAAYLRLITRPEATRRLLDPIPSLLVTFGILGTFLGLGIAVGGAANALSTPDQAVPALKDLLQAVRFKFQSSAWGVILSLLFTVVIRLPVEAYVERVLEAAAEALVGARRNAGEQIANALKEAVTNSFGLLSNKLIGSVDALQISVQSLRTTMAEVATSLGTSTHELAAAAKKMQGLGNDINASLGNVSREISGKLEAANAQFSRASDQQSKALGAQLDVVTRKLESSLTTMTSGFSIAVGEQKKTAESMQRELGGALARLDGGLTKSSTDMAAALHQLNEQQSLAMGKTSDEISRSLRQSNEQFREVSQQQAKTLDGQLAGVARSLDGSLKTMTSGFSVAVGEQKKAAEGMQRELSGALARLDDVLGKSSTGMAVALRQLNEQQTLAMGKTSEEISRSLRQSNEQFREVSQQQAKTLDGQLAGIARSLDGSLKTMTEGANAASDAQKRAAADLQRQVGGVLTELNGAVGQLRTDINSSLDHLNKHQAYTTASIGGLEKTLAQLPHHLGHLLEIIDQVRAADSNALHRAKERREQSMHDAPRPTSEPSHTGRSGSEDANDDFA